MEPSLDIGTLFSQGEKNLNERDTSAEAKKVFSPVICTGGTVARAGSATNNKLVSLLIKSEKNPRFFKERNPLSMLAHCFYSVKKLK